jgi:hypothetical protein
METGLNAIRTIGAASAHDSIWGVWLDNGLAPLFMKIRDDMPNTTYAEPLYRSAICLATDGPNRGAFFQGK